MLTSRVQSMFDLGMGHEFHAFLHIGMKILTCNLHFEMWIIYINIWLTLYLASSVAVANVSCA